MNFSKLLNVKLNENPIIELSSAQLSFITGGKKGHHKSSHKSKSSSSKKHSSSSYVNPEAVLFRKLLP